MTCHGEEHDVMCDGNGECFKLAEQLDEALAALREIACGQKAWERDQMIDVALAALVKVEGK
jgi:hypothetical protein